jgi:hypothetical protein
MAVREYDDLGRIVREWIGGEYALHVSYVIKAGAGCVIEQPEGSPYGLGDWAAEEQRRAKSKRTETQDEC